MRGSVAVAVFAGYIWLAPLIFDYGQCQRVCRIKYGSGMFDQNVLGAWQVGQREMCRCTNSVSGIELGTTARLYQPMPFGYPYINEPPVLSTAIDGDIGGRKNRMVRSPTKISIDTLTAHIACLLNVGVGGGRSCSWNKWNLHRIERCVAMTATSTAGAADSGVLHYSRLDCSDLCCSEFSAAACTKEGKGQVKVLHCGVCGKCSNPHDISMLRAMSNNISQVG